MLKYSLFILLSFSLFLSSCSSKKKQAELLELSKPIWLKERPNHPNYWYGIGITPKVGAPMFYEEKAKERALSDLSKQISTQISSESNFYKVEDTNGIREYIQSRIKATSSEFLEGYEYLDKWQDDKNYYAYYRLSKQEFYARKAKRKADAISNATLKYQQAQEKEAMDEQVAAIELYAACMDVLSGYMNEEAAAIIAGDKTDLIAESKDHIVKIIQAFTIKVDDDQIVTISGQTIKEGHIRFSIFDSESNGISNVPVRFHYSGGYLMNELAKSSDTGNVPSPAFKKSNIKTEELLIAEIDLINLGRQVTKNLYVRKIIEKQKKNKKEVMVINQ